MGGWEGRRKLDVWLETCEGRLRALRVGAAPCPLLSPRHVALLRCCVFACVFVPSP